MAAIRKPSSEESVEQLSKNALIQMEQIDLNSNNEVATEQISHIHTLTNEILDYILTFLSIRERIQTELVCKRWRVIGKSQPWSEPKSINFDVWKRSKLNSQSFKAVLLRCGSKLQGLQLADCDFPELSDFHSFEMINQHCPNIEKLELSLQLLCLPYDFFDSIGYYCRNLKSVTIRSWGKTKMRLENFFRHCKMLEELYLCGDNLCPTSDDFKEINKNLKVLSLADCDNLQAEALETFVDRCDNVEELHINGNGGSCMGVTPLLLTKIGNRYCSTLRVLDLMGYEVDLIGCVAAVKNLQKLEDFTLGFLDRVTHLGNLFIVDLKLAAIHVSSTDKNFHNYLVKSLLEDCKNVRVMELRSIYDSLPDFVDVCLKFKHSLRCLKLEVVDVLQMDNWSQLFSATSHLEVLILESCKPRITDEVAQVIATNCRKVKLLKIAPTSVTDEGLLAIATFPELVELSLGDATAITDHGVTALAMSTQGRLEIFHLSNDDSSQTFSQISDESCCLFAKLCPNFRELEIHDAPKVTNKLVRAFKESILEGFLKNSVTLHVENTSVTHDCGWPDGLRVKFQLWDF